MKVIKATQQMLETRTLVLGFQGENLRTQLRIDCSTTFSEYPNATPALAIKPPTGATYPVFVERDGNEVVWDIVANNLALKGDGELQLTFYKDSVIAKTSIGHITVNRSLQIDGEMPDVVATWIENANRKLAEVDAQIVELEGMVDTATDAATRAEQSASTASTRAEQAAGSAATATEKATEATQAAGTATAKAAEAQLQAQYAINSAQSAAESERIATAKAVEATTAAGTATAKAEQATEAAQTATGKAEEASASATAAQTSATDAASSATAASASETAAKASETAAGASATQAAQSAQTASTDAQTATQKAGEAATSATNAATSATNAATSAETASTKSGEAAQSAQAVEETAEQLADSLEQIDQNTQDIAELDERKANIDGYYPDMTVGNAEQLNSSKFVENFEPYTLRTSGGSSDIGNREYVDAVVGGTLAWNQMVRDEASTNETDFAPIVTVDDAVEDAAGVKVKIEPVQDLHGYDHPWPAGGGKNLIVPIDRSFTNNGVPCVCSASAETVSLKGTATDSGGRTGKMTKDIVLPAGTYTLSITAVSGTRQATYIVNRTDNNSYISTATFSLAEETSVYVGANVLSDTVYDEVVHIQIEAGSTATAWTPYSNICPISGWDGVKVTRTGKNLFDKAQQTHLYCDGSLRTYINADMTSVYVPLLPNTTYTFSQSIVGEFTRYSLIDALENLTDMYSPMNPLNKGYISHTSLPFTFTNTNRKYLLCTIYRASVDTDKTFDEIADSCQLEYGSTATDYEPYAGNIYDITLPTEAGTVYGGELTVNEDGSGSLVVDSINYDVSNDTSWAIAGTILGGTYFYKRVIADANLPLYVASELAFAKTNEKYSCGHIENPYDHAENCAWAYRANDGGYLRIGFSDEMGIDTIEKFNDWRANNTVQIYYPLLNPTTYTLTASQITTLLGTNNVWSDAGQTALTYTGTDEHLTLESGKKYLTRISGTDSMLLGSGQEITAAKGTDNVFDLTQMFGTAVADYVYGQGAAFFRKWFPNAVYPYNAGELKHVEGLQSHDMVGFNQWDEEWESGAYDSSTGEKTVNESWWRSKNAIRVIPETVYCAKAQMDIMNICFYDAAMNFILQKTIYTRNAYATFTVPSDAYYLTFYIWKSTPKEVCINLSHNGSRNGEYEPYEKHSYPLDSSVILRGIPKVGTNGVYWDGDRYLPDGTIERRYGVVDLGTVNWLYRNSLFDGSLPNGKLTSTREGGTLAVCSKYAVFPLHWSSLTDGQACVGGGYVNSSTCSIVVKDSAYTDAAAFKSAMSGVLLVYELATPTTETAQPYHSTQWVSDWGTEEFVSTGIVPVGHETRYPANLRDKLQHLPDAASGNGSYLISQTDGQMVLTPFPAPPSTAGNYVLKATVTNGVATYTWEVAT